MPKQGKHSSEPKSSTKPVEGTAFFERSWVKWHADTREFRADPPLKGHSRIIVIAAITPHGYEMMVWGVREDGSYEHKLIESFRSQLPEHRKALATAGYVMHGDVERFPRPKG